MEEIGIHIRAKAELQDIMRTSQELKDMGGISGEVGEKMQQLTERLKKTADTDVSRLTKQIDELQKKSQAPGTTRQDRQMMQEQTNQLREQVKELQMMQRIKVDDFGSMSRQTRLYLEQLKTQTALTDKEKERYKLLKDKLGLTKREQEEKLVYEERIQAQKDIKDVERMIPYLERTSLEEAKLAEMKLNRMRQDLKTQEEEAGKYGLGEMGIGRYGKRMIRQIEGVVIGGSIIAVAAQAMKKWADLDTQIIRTEMSLDNMSKTSVEGLTAIGNAIGYTKEEALAYLNIITAISGRMDMTEARGFGNLLGWGRAMGVGEVGLQMRELQRWGGEGIRPGTDKYFLAQFTELARMLNMREGRMSEFIETAIELTKTMERTFIKIEDQDIIRNILFPAMVFGGADRGRGQRGLSYMQRLNEAITGGGNMLDLVMYRTLGMPQGWEQLWEMKGIREKGVFGMTEAGEPLIMGLMRNIIGMFGSGARGRVHMQSMFKDELSKEEIDQMFDMYLGLQAGNWNMETGELSKTMIEQLKAKGIEYGKFKTEEGEEVYGLLNMTKDTFNIIAKDFPKFVENFMKATNISAGERWKTAIESMQYSVGGTFGKTTIELLTAAALGIDALARKITPGTYESRKEKIIQAGTVYSSLFNKQTENLSQQRLDEITAIIEGSYGKKPGEKGHLTAEEFTRYEEEQKHLLELKQNNYLQIAEEIRKQYNAPQQITAAGEVAKTPIDLYQEYLGSEEYKGWGKYKNIPKLVKLRTAAREYLEQQIAGITHQEIDAYLDEIVKSTRKGAQPKIVNPQIGNLLIEQKKAEIEILEKQYQGSIDWEAKYNRGYAEDELRRLMIPINEADRGKLDNVKELKAEKLIITGQPDSTKASVINNYHYHYHIEGADLISVERNPETGIKITTIQPGLPRDNSD